MQLEALKIYCDVVRFHSFSRGAEENNVLQSSASQAVRNLENSLGVALIDRSRRPWEVTDEGRAFYEGCRQVVDLYQEVVAKVRNIRSAGTSVVRVAAIYSVNLRDMRHCVQEFNRMHPNVQVEIEYHHPNRVLERVLDDEADIGILSYPEERGGFCVIPWRDEPMMLVCRPDHRFANLKKFDLKQLDGEALVSFDTDLVIWKKTDRFLKEHGVQADVRLRFDNIESIKRAVEAGSGLALLPKPPVEAEVQLGTLTAIPLASGSFHRPIGIIHRKGRRLYESTQAFIDVLKNHTNGSASLRQAERGAAATQQPHLSSKG